MSSLFCYDLRVSKLTTKGNRRRDAQIQVLTANKRTVGATNYTKTEPGRGEVRMDLARPVTWRNIREQK